MSFFKGLSKTWLVGVNLITLLLGLAVSGFSIFLLARYGDFSSEHFYTKRAAIAGIVAGLLTACFSLLGCMSAKKQNKCGLCAYVIGMSLILIVLFAAGIVGLIFLGKMDPSDVGSEKINELSSDLQKDILNFELNIFNSCGCPGTPAVVSCDDATATTYCTTSDLKLGGSVCTALNEFKFDGNALVGDNTAASGDNEYKAASCAGCNTVDCAKTFVQTIHDAFEKNFKPISIAFIVLCVIQLLCIIFSCCLICMNRADYDEQYRKRMEEQRRAAGDMTGVQGGPAYGTGNQYV